MNVNPSTGRRIWAWCLFDFANSPYTTLVVTFVYSTYFIKTFAPNEVIGTAWYHARFTNHDAGTAGAIAIILLLAIIPVMLINIRRFQAQEAIR